MSDSSETRVEEQSDGTFRVRICAAGGETEHSVTIPEGLSERLGWAGADPAELVRESFAFLLQREPPTSILRRFRLDQIGDYFPEYAVEMRGRRRT